MNVFEGSTVLLGMSVSGVASLSYSLFYFYFKTDKPFLF